MIKCNDHSLEALLDVDDAGAELRDVARHVESCEQCQTRLAELAAEADDWREAKKWLSHRDAPRGDQTGPWHRRHGRRPLAWTESMANQILLPPSHPEMLGRIGRYDIERLIGAGGMGVVFKGFDTELNRPVAVKVLAPYLAGSGAARRRFAREARAAAAVVDEHVVAIHNVESDGESPFLVMQYVAGESLQTRLDRCGPLEICEILRIGTLTAAGLAAAHAQGLIHRDVKPANILLEEGVDRALLTDFGLARAADDASLTRTGYHPGTPQYMSPEQARGEPVDPRSDLFSLGSVLYAMCTGRAPFRAETSYGVLRRITDDAPRPIREINPDVPQWLCRIIDKLMSKNAGARYGSARDVAEVLEQCLAHVQRPTDVPLPAMAAVQRPKSARGGRKRSVVHARIAVVFMFVALAFGGCGLWLWQSAQPPAIAGRWTGEGWGQVILDQVSPGRYEGTYSDTFGDEPGGLQFQWSRIERRFKGSWREGQDRYGKISLRLVGNEIRGAWTTNENSQINPGTPELADLVWTRGEIPPVRSDRSPSAPDDKPRRQLDAKALLERVPQAGGPLPPLPLLRAQPRRTWRFRGPVSSVEFAPDGKHIAVATGNQIVVVDAGSGATLFEINRHQERVWRVTYSPDGRLLASASRDRTVRLWDAANGRPLDWKREYAGEVRWLMFTGDSRALITAPEERDDYRIEFCALPALAAMTSASAASDGTGESGDSRVLPIRNFYRSTEFKSDVPYHFVVTGSTKGNVWGTDFYTDDSSPSAAAVHAGAVRDGERALVEVTLTPSRDSYQGTFRNGVTSMSYDRWRGRCFTIKRIRGIENDATLDLHKSTTGSLQGSEVVKTIRGSRSTIFEFAVSADSNRMASAESGGPSHLWDLANGQLLAADNHPGGVTAVEFSRDGKLLASGGWDNKLRIRSALDGKYLRQIVPPGGTPGIDALQWLPNSRTLLYACRDGVMGVVEVESGTILQRFQGHDGPVLDLDLSPHSRTIVSGGSRDDTVKLWDVVTEPARLR